MIIAEFKIPYFRFLNPDGQLMTTLPESIKNPEQLIELYKMMVRTRVFDTKAIALQRTGKLGTYPSMLGQEAISLGFAACMADDDVFCPYYRDCGGQFWRGVKMSEILLYWGGDERGSDFANNRNDFPICVPVGSQTLHAVGVATAMKLKNEKRVTVVVVGDGGTSRGDFYEAINLAGVWELPVVFVINNNQWAISMNRQSQSRAETLAQKGIAGGLACEQIDGNDIIAVFDSAERAISRAREGFGATVIEAVSYRMGDHTTADDARRYRNATELETHKNEDPIFRLRQYLIAQNLWSEEKEEKLNNLLVEEVQNAVTEYLAIEPLAPETMFDYLYAKLPDSLELERDEALHLKTLSLKESAHNGTGRTPHG